MHQGKGGQQDPHHDPQYTGLSWQVLPRDSAQRGEKLLPLLVPALGGGCGIVLLPSLSETSTSKSDQKSSWTADISHEAAPG